MDVLDKPIRLMVRSDFLNPGHPLNPISSQGAKLFILCQRLKIKHEEPKCYPYDRVWITPRTLNQKLALVQFFGLDLLQKLNEAQPQ